MASPAPRSFGPELPFTAAELATCVKVVACLREHRGLFLAPWARPLRQAVGPLAGTLNQVEREMTGKKREREIVSMRRGLLEQARHLDQDNINKCRLRSGRIAKLQKLVRDQDISASVPLIPDGPVREDGDHNVPRLLATDTKQKPTDRELFCPRKCYVCQLHFTQLHAFYDKLCPPCAALNYAKRHQTADLRGKVALVTGARVKIGYFTTLKLLHAGATVIATTRFPCDALERFQREDQYEVFKERLHVFGVDLRDLVHLHCFLDYIASTFTRLDIIIHNAAQTIRRPPQYYRHLMEKELALKTSQLVTQPLLSHYITFQSKLDKSIEPRRVLDSSTPVFDEASALATRAAVAFSSALKSQIPMLASDCELDLEAFPEGMLDVNGQQVDLRSQNSWVLRLGQVETPELAEVLTINAMAPFVINNKLLPMLERDVNASEPKFIVNVSAMEGKFNRAKRCTHPHTNMAKAALNMMTRTCASDLSHRKIYMNSVDTGWINDENPLPVAARQAAEGDFQTPLDEIDAAARVLDPIFTSVADPHATPEWGSFLKDYKPTEW